MSDFRKLYQINIESLFQNGTACTSPTITWEKPDCINIRCELLDGKTLKVEVPEDCTDGCIYVNIDCGDECGDCEPHRLKICPCSIPADCEDCETCIDNICVSKCDPDEFCSDDKCVDCDPDHPCDCNKECVAGKCVCPANLPYEDDKGCCHACEDDGDCPTCYYCTPDGCKPKECLCDPLSGECVECYNSGHCGTNECCVGNKCECCAGFKRNPDTGECEPFGECETDGDCGPCKICDDGDCVQVGCPEGYVYTGGSPCCAKRCDCDDPNCPTGQDCVRLNDVDCYCNDCSGPCENDSDCEYGCECDEDTSNCIKKTCDGPCDFAEDCAPGCGCFQGECVDCSTLTCDQCRLVSGCKCTDSETCEPSGCDSPCIEDSDCGYGCGCDFGGECVDCSSVSCDAHEDCPYGCYCDEGSSLCKPNPCSKACISGDDCESGCKCGGDRCVPCDPSDPECDGGKKPCADILEILKNDADCSIEGKLTTEGCCGCDSIGVSFQLNNIVKDATTGILTYEVDSYVRLGSFTDFTSFAGLPKLSETGVENELPFQGSIKLIAELTYSEIDVNGNFIPGGSTFVVSTDDTEDYTNSDTEEYDMTHQDVKATHTNGTHKVLKIDLYAQSTIDFEFPNECRYFLTKTKVQTFTNSGSFLNSVKIALPLTKKVFCRLPLFYWYKSDSTTIFSVPNLFKKVYAERLSATMYHDIVDSGDADPLELCKYYGLQTPCGCDNQTTYTCLGNELIPNKLTFCSPTDIVVLSQNSCNTSIKIKEAAVCDLMEGEDYILYINGEEYGTYTATSGKLFTGDITITVSDPIYEVKLVFPCDDCDLCTIVKTLELLEPCACSVGGLTITLGDYDCATGFTYAITGGTAPYNIRIVHIDSADNEHLYIDTDVTSGTVTGPLSNGQYIVKVTDKLGCIEETTLTVEDCCEFDVVSATYSCTTNKVSITFNSTPVNPTATLSGNTVNVIGGVADFGVLTNGSYSLIVSDAEGCPETITLNVNCCASIVIDSITSPDCEVLTVTLSGAGAAGVDQYRIDHTGPWVSFTPPTITLGSPLSTGFHAVCVRDATFPGCEVCAAYKCTTCATYDLMATLDLDCDESALVLSGVVVPSNVNSCTGSPGYTWNIYKDSGLTPVASGSASWAMWGTTMEFPLTNIGNGGTYRLVIKDCKGCTILDDSVTSTPLTLSMPPYDCGGTYLTYSFLPGDATLTYQCASGCSPAIPAGTAAPASGSQLSDGTYIFTLTKGGCTVTQTVVVACGGGTADPDCTLIDGVDYVVNQSGCNVSLINNSYQSITVYLETLNNLPNFCTGSVIQTVTLGVVPPAGTISGNIVYQGYAHRLRLNYASADLGDPEPCEVVHCLSVCSGSGSCTVDPLSVCVQSRLSSAKLKVTNLNTNSPVVLFVSRTSATSFVYTPQIIAPGASWISSISQDAALPGNVGTYHIKAVCVYDQTILWDVTYTGLAQIPDC